MSSKISNEKRDPDGVLTQIADYVCDHEGGVNDPFIPSDEALTTARFCLADTLGCGLLALNFPECTKMLGPVVPGTVVPNGALVPGTSFTLDPIRAAFNIGTMIRWLDFNDTWLAAEWGHPSDNLGGILATADHLSRCNVHEGKPPLHMRDVLIAMIKAHEIQGCLALENSFNQVGLDHVLLVKVASAAVVGEMLGANHQQLVDIVSHAFIDNAPLRTYRHAPNAGSRKSWAAGDATSRAVHLVDLVLRGEMGYATALSAEKWGFYDVLFKEKAFTFQRPYGSYVMENVLFKISFPAEFHAQTAVEAAVILHPQIVDRLDDIDSIALHTHESAIRIIDKDGPLHNPADRDHCLQYMVAMGLIHGGLTAEHYEDIYANDPRVDPLRAKMKTVEIPTYSKDYHDPEKRSIANAIEITFKDGSKTERIEVEYPIGHRRRRKEGLPVLMQKFERNLATRLPAARVATIISLFNDTTRLEKMPVHTFTELFRV